MEANVSAMVAAGAGVGAIGLLTIPGLRRTAGGAAQVLLRKTTTVNGRAGGWTPLPPRDDDDRASPAAYEDADGAATEESEKAFAATAVWPKVAACLSAAAGLAAAVGAIVASYRAGDAPLRHAVRVGVWLDLAAWLLLCLQCAFALPRRRPTVTFRLGLCGFASATALVTSIVFQHGVALFRVPNRHVDLEAAAQLLTLAEVLLGFLAGLAFALFPRRPDVYRDGVQVDRQFTGPLLSRLTFSWMEDLIDLARVRQLNMEDLPALDHLTRSADIYDDYVARRATGRLWWLLVRAHTFQLALQWAMTFLRVVLSFVPQYVLFHFLQRLEDRSEGLPVDATLFVWVVALGLSFVLEAWLFSNLRWITSTRLEMPVASLLQSLVFAKATRLHESHNASKDKEAEGEDEDDADAAKKKKADGDVENGNGNSNGSANANKDQPKPKPPKDAADVQTKQSIVNHMKLDSGRVSMFCTFNNDFPSALLKLLIAGTALVQLLGWPAFVSGFVASVLVIPMTSKLSKAYSKIQFGMMKYRDARAHILTEALQGMRQIKFSALEGYWEDKILRSRENELRQYWKITLAICALISVANLGPLLLETVSLSMYALSHATEIKASIVFTALALFEQLNMTVAIMPLLAAYVLEAWTSCCRLEKFFDQPERRTVTSAGDQVAFDDATVSWPRAPDAPEDELAEERSMLRNVTLAFPNGKLSVVTGRTGSGKSLLLAAILSEVDLHGGKIHVPQRPDPTESYSASLAATTGETSAADWILPSQMAFVSQSPWIEGITVRENIVFGLPMDAARYDRCLHACALEKDLSLLAEGDATEVGPKGVTLSGGQRWRIALARALYSRAGILVLDDVLSAVDAHVGRRIVDEVLDGELARGRTRILATHHAELVLPKAAYFVRLKDGRVEHVESLADPADASRALAREMRAADDPAAAQGSASGEELPSDASTEVDPDAVLPTPPLEAIALVAPPTATTAPAPVVEAVANGRATSTAQNGTENDNGAPTADKAANKKDKDEEKRQVGRVDWHVYRTYWAASGGWLLWAISIGLRVATQLMHVAENWSLKELTDTVTGVGAKLVALFVGPASDPYPYPFMRANWGGGAGTGGHLNASATTHGGGMEFAPYTTTTSQHHGTGLLSALGWPVDSTWDPTSKVKFYVAMYVVLYIAVVVGYIIQTVVSFVLGLRACRIFFRRMTHAVLRAPLRWIDTVPSGRILNRFTSDTAIVDRRLAQDLGLLMSGFLTVVVILGTSLAVSKYVIFFGIILFFLYAYIGRRYMAAARDTKRIGSVSNSPIYDQFSSVLSGLTTIRAYDRTGFYRQRLCQLIDDNQRASWSQNLLTRWMNFRMTMLGAVFTTVVAATVVLGNIDAALAGFTLTFSLQYSSSIIGLLMKMAEIELDFNAAERMVEYMENPTEPQDGADAPAAWPQEGRIEVNHLDVAYAPDLDPVLRDLNFDVAPRERIGIVGRTGAGKSTLAHTLFRLLEPRAGSIRIDGLDIASLKLATLRSRLAIIPQDPFLFSGTLRSNLDMLNERDDTDLLAALRAVHLIRPDELDGGESEAAAEEAGESSAATAADAASSTSGTQTTSTTTHATTTTTTPAAEANPLSDLSMAISTGGLNLSQGQRQLVCLARALLARPKVVVLDEATSAVDHATDAAIQASIRSAFADSTVLVIAHRLSTIADFDRVLVLAEGRVVEYASPKELLLRGEQQEGGAEEDQAKPSAVFAELVDKSAERDKLRAMILGDDGKE